MRAEASSTGLAGAPSAVIGWDIGGAHVKACLLIDGAVHEVRQWATPLWKGLNELDAAIEQARRSWPQFGAARHALTMTAEMTDLFDDRAAGVRELSAHLVAALGDGLRFYAGPQNWLSAHDAARCWREVASANWLASAEWIGRRLDSAILVDIGSTTTDLIAVLDGQPAPQGRSDAARLASGELVYLGVVRTPLCALARQVSFDGEEVNVMNEFFATTADVFRLSGELDAAQDQYPAADDGAKDEAGTCRRLARMIGRDASDAGLAAWQALAGQWRSAFVREIERNFARVRARDRRLAGAVVVGAGCGSFLAGEIARRAGLQFLPFAAIAAPLPSSLPPLAAAAKATAHAAGSPWVDACAPCVAVARLALEDEACAGW